MTCPAIGTEHQCPKIGTESECLIDGQLCSARKNRIYILDINDEEFIYVNFHEIYTTSYHVSASTIAEILGNALKVKVKRLDAQELADDDTDATYDEICLKAIRNDLEKE